MKYPKTRTEPWFKAWLILTPIIAFGSYYLARNVWRRTQAMLQRQEQSIWEAPPAPEIAEPWSFVGYGIASGVFFSIFWFVISKVYIQSQNKTDADAKK